jgi:protein-export membrane protein SecD
MARRIIPALVILILAGLLGWFVISTNNPSSHYSIKLGLDLAGGTELIYKADTSNVAAADVDGALSSLQQVIERRVNLFGVAEPLVQIEYANPATHQSDNRLLVDLPGVTNVQAAVTALGQTPTLEFKLESTSTPEVVPGMASSTATSSAATFVSTGLTGAYLKNAALQFSSGTSGSSVTGAPLIILTFNDQGAALFDQITTNNVGRTLGIFLDGQLIEAPVIQEAIPGGVAQINGSFTPDQARDLVQNLNFGALPIPITLESSDTVGPTLGGISYKAGLIAGIIGFAIVSLFMILWYRLPGLVATVALTIYLIVTIAIIKVVPVTLTASGIAGLIISLGIAVDANVLIFERMKEELRAGKGPREAAHIGFGRAWPAIRDGHLTMLVSGLILFWLGTSIVQGFALVFSFGVLTSLLSAVFISRIFLFALLPEQGGKVWHFLVGSGVGSGKTSTLKESNS